MLINLFELVFKQGLFLSEQTLLTFYFLQMNA